jgi:hypothetical protein
MLLNFRHIRKKNRSGFSKKASCKSNEKRQAFPMAFGLLPSGQGLFNNLWKTSSGDPQHRSTNMGQHLCPNDDFIVGPAK